MFMLLWDHLEQMHGVGREQADRCERKTSKAEATCEPSERHHAWYCWISRRRIISTSAENRGNSCQRKHPAEILALGPSCASHRRSSNANSLCGRNSARSPEICATLQRDNLQRHF
jgi:hypothetical protein